MANTEIPQKTRTERERKGEEKKGRRGEEGKERGRERRERELDFLTVVDWGVISITLMEVEPVP